MHESVLTMADALDIPSGYEHRSSNSDMIKTCDGIGYTVTSIYMRIRLVGGDWITLYNSSDVKITDV